MGRQEGVFDAPSRACKHGGRRDLGLVQAEVKGVSGVPATWKKHPLPRPHHKETATSK